MAKYQTDAKNDNKRDYAYNRIKEMIISNELPGGTFLIERQLCDKLGLSRTPVRSALQELINDKLAVGFPGKGIMVAEITVKDVSEVDQLREVLDVLALKLFLHKLDNKPVIDKMRSHVLSMKEMLESNNFEDMTMHDMAFHSCYLNNTGNSRLQEILRSLWNQMQRIVFSVKSMERYQETYREHQQIMDAIDENDFEKAQEMLRAHMIASKVYHIERLS